MRPGSSNSSDLVRRFFDVTLDLACINDGRHLRHVNSRWSEVLGHDEEELLSRPMTEFIHPDDREATVALLNRLIETGGETRFECRWVDSAGEWHWLSWTARLDAGSGLVLSTARDITSERRLEQERDRINAVLESVGRLQAAYIEDGLGRSWWDEALRTVIDLTDSRFGFVGRVEHDSEGAPFLRSYAVSDIAWNEWSRRHYEAYAEGGMEFHNLGTLFGVTLAGGGLVISDDPANDPRSGGLPHGHPPLESYAGIPLNDPEGLVGMVGIANRPGGFDGELVALLEPITAMLAQIISRDVSSKRALRDPLTGLANRSALMDEIEPLLADGERRRAHFGLLLVDLDDFKEINDSMGHHVGDSVLVEAGRAAASALRSGDLVARIGGDEFAVLLPDCDLDEVEQAGIRLRSRIAEVSAGPGRKLRASIGGVVIGGRPRSWEDVYRIADSNLYEAKRAGGQRTAITSVS